MDQSKFEEYRAAAIAKYGPPHKRPQEKYEGLLKRRQLINKKDFFIESHPLGDEIRSWYLPREWLKPVEITSSPEIKFIYRLDQFVKLNTIINSEKIFSIGFKESCGISYHAMISILVVFVGSISYVIDTFALFNAVKPILGNVFGNPEIVKICYSGALIPKLQRDFEIYTAGVLVLTEVLKETPCKKVDTIHELFFELFGEQYDFLTVFAAWDARPLLCQLITRAGLEVFLLMKTWNFCVEKLGESLVMLNFEETVKSNLQLYSHEEYNGPEHAYEVILCNIIEDKLTIFVQRRNLFCELYEWRNNVCKDNDFDLSSFLSLSALSTFVCEVPSSLEDLSSILPTASAWDLAISESLLKLCSKIYKPDPVEYNFIPVFWSHREDNFSEETNEACIRYHHLIEVTSKKNHWLSKSQQRKLRLKQINNQRTLTGDLAIQLRRNRGRKDRERSKRRAIEWERRHLLNC